MISDNYRQKRRALSIAIGILILVLLLGNNASAATIITVPDNYTKIQWAIDNATAGATIEVHSGIYYENVNVNKQLTLSGIGMPVVDAGISGSAITLSANGITLEGFTATGGGNYPEAGIKVFSNNNTLRGNNASNNGYGIILSSSGKNNTLSGNNASSNDYGIFLSSSSNNTLSGNNVKSNTYYGIFLGSSGNNTLRGNNASKNYYGIDMSSSNNNNIYHNNLIENTYQALDNTNTNFWNTGYPSGGNYWSDYTGFDLESGVNQDITGSDGIGDSPYSISDGAQDRYPFMNESGWVGIKYPLSKIVISGLPITTLTIGESHLLTATALDQNDNPVEGINVSWRVSHSSIGNVGSPNVITNVTGGATSTFTALVAGTTLVNASNGSITGTAFVTVGNVPPPSFISFTDPTPANGAILSQNYAFINTTVSNPSTAFIDWNRSLIGWWRFNGESGENSTFFRDWSDRGNNATCSGINCPTSTPGKFGNALNFDGSNDYIIVPNSAILNPSNITLEAWFNANSGGLADQKPLIQKPYTSHAAPYYQYMLSLADSVGSPKASEFYLTVNGVMRSIEVKNLSYTYGQWHYLAGTYDGSTMTLYLDGNIIGATPIVGTITSYNTVLEFGAYPNVAPGPSNVFKGKLDEARIHSRALSPDEIKASYNAGFSRLYNNFTNLATGIYNYRAFGQDLSGNVNKTETRSLTIVSYQGAPAITSFSPASPVNDIAGALRRFNITLNQTVNVNWYINGTPVQSNTSVIEAIYINISSMPGTRIVNATATNANGTVSREWTWIVSSLPVTSNSISFIDPTPANNAILGQNYAFINTTVSNISTAFIDWNRSLIGWWRFNGESGENPTFFRDWSSRGNNATCSGINCPLSNPGKFGNALNFDGSNDYVTVPDSAILNPLNITLETWFNANSGGLASQKPLIQKPYTSHAAPYYQYMLSLTDTVGYPKAAEFYLTINGVMQDIEIKNLSYNYGQWHYLAGTYNGSTMTMYLDGNIVGRTQIVGTITSYNTILEFGAYTNVAPGSSNVFNGKLDEARIHSRALSPDEIKASYNAGISRLYSNFTNLATGAYNYKAYDQNLAGNVNQTETRTLTVTSEFTPIKVTNPDANPAIILNDNGRPRPPGTNITRLNVTVTGNVASVIINLSSLGGLAKSPMTRISGTDIYSINTNATAGINLTNYLVVNVTDTRGNFNNSAGIPVSVLLRGDIVRDNKIDLKDLLYMRRHLAGLEPSINTFVADIQQAQGDGSVDLKDLLYLRRYLAGLEPLI
jgi:parallel beta-helix repeat protein